MLYTTNVFRPANLLITSAAVLPCLMISALLTSAAAIEVPAPADASRVKPPVAAPSLREGSSDIKTDSSEMQKSAPEGAKNIHLTLNGVDIEGATAIPAEQLKRFYSQYIGKDVTLDVAWLIADRITKEYHRSGYFLSAAYVPEQEVNGGVIKIKIIEGYIGKVVVDSKNGANDVINGYIERLLSHRPLTMDELESFMLRINDLPGEGWFGSIEPTDSSNGEGFVILRIVPAREAIMRNSSTNGNEGKFTASVNNYGSRYLGPYQLSAGFSKSLLELQQTSVSVLSSIPANEIKSVSFDHSGYVMPDLKLFTAGSFVTSHPGFSLSDYDIQSKSIDFSVGASYQLIRQREENLSLTTKLRGKNTHGDVFFTTPMTRDKIRATSLALAYDTSDHWNGYDAFNLTVTQGIAGMGSSKKGDSNLSRAQADPSFSKLEFSYNREQYISPDFSISGYFTSQISSSPLFSSEEFGYGGSVVGRAYDPSEITGDSGVALALELDYNSLPAVGIFHFQPFAFYDIGKVWNRDIGSTPQAGASAGFGIKTRAENGLSSTIGLAFPLTRPESAPIYGGHNSPRIMFDFSTQF